MTTRTALVTGATSGIGLATAQRLLDNGYDVVGTSRDPAHIPAESRLEGVRYRGLDLTDIYAIEGFVTAIGAEGIHVDVVVNNAGESQSGPLEDLPIGALERVFRLNVLGPVHLTQLLLPGMRQRGYGRVVMVGSMLASFPLAYRSSYVASKAALKGFATATRYEMAPHGVWLSTVEPGSVKTGISDRRTNYIAPDSPHDESFRAMLRVLDRAEREGIAPARVARTVLRAIEATEPDALYAVGNNASAIFALQRALPQSIIEGVVARKFGVHRRKPTD
jgi:short-subunit dehydrogenase